MGIPFLSFYIDALRQLHNIIRKNCSLRLLQLVHKIYEQWEVFYNLD